LRRFEIQFSGVRSVSAVTDSSTPSLSNKCVGHRLYHGRFSVRRIDRHGLRAALR
jgi:type VI protein secretion system component Hcp